MRPDTDIGAELRAEAFALQVGLRPHADPRIVRTVREALLAGVMVKFLYGEGINAALCWRKVIPYGLLFAPRFHLVARIKSKPEPVFDWIVCATLNSPTSPGAPPEDFNLEAYASRSFGVSPAV